MRTALMALAALLLALGSASAQTVVVDRAACARLLVEHRTSDDVAYKPGADTRGRAVAPADLAPATPPLLQPEFTFDLRVDLAPYLPARSRLLEPQLQVGRVGLRSDGAITFNGIALESAERAALATLCRRTTR
jgi:hypothetical protein